MWSSLSRLIVWRAHNYAARRTDECTGALAISGLPRYVRLNMSALLILSNWPFLLEPVNVLTLLGVIRKSLFD